MLTPWFLKDGLGKGSVGPSGHKEREQTLVVSGRTKIIRKEMVDTILKEREL